MNFRNAYKVACLGVTEGDWRALAMEAMEVMYSIQCTVCSAVWCGVVTTVYSTVTTDSTVYGVQCTVVTTVQCSAVR